MIGVIYLEDFEFSELIEIVQEVYGDFRNGAIRIGENDTQSLERFFNDYKNIIERGICESAIIYSTLCLELQKYNIEWLSRRHYERMISIINKYDDSKVASSLNSKEISELNKQVTKARSILNDIQVG